MNLKAKNMPVITQGGRLRAFSTKLGLAEVNKIARKVIDQPATWIPTNRGYLPTNLTIEGMIARENGNQTVISFEGIQGGKLEKTFSKNVLRVVKGQYAGAFNLCYVKPIEEAHGKAFMVFTTVINEENKPAFEQVEASEIPVEFYHALRDETFATVTGRECVFPLKLGTETVNVTVLIADGMGLESSAQIFVPCDQALLANVELDKKLAEAIADALKFDSQEIEVLEITGDGHQLELATKQLFTVPTIKAIAGLEAEAVAAR